MPPLATARPDLPRPLTAAIDAGLDPDPAARPDAQEMAGHLAEARGGLGAAGVAARRRGARVLPVAASAAGGAALAAAGLAAADGQLAQHLSANWQRPGVAVAAIALAGLVFAWRPRAAAALAVAAGAVLVSLASPAAAAVLGVVALAVVATGWRTGRLLLLPAAAPALFAIGLGPLYPALAGLVPRWPARLWAAASGMAAALAWQVAAGSDGLLAGGTPCRRPWGPSRRAHRRPPPGGRCGIRWPPGRRPSCRPRRWSPPPCACRWCSGPARAARASPRARAGWRPSGPRWWPPPPTRPTPWGRWCPRRSWCWAGRPGPGGSCAAACPRRRPLRCVGHRMSLLRDIEQKIEGLFERSFRRAFRSSLQPVELARKLAREMEDHKTVSVSRVYVPNEFTVYLAPQDRESFASYELSLTTELAAYLEAHARTAGLSLVAPAVVGLVTDTDLRAGEFGIGCRMAEAPPAEAGRPPLQRKMPHPAEFRRQDS